MNLVNEVVDSQYSVVPLKPGREGIKRRTECPRPRGAALGSIPAVSTKRARGIRVLLRASTRALRISLKFCTNEARIYTGLNPRFRRMLVSRSEMLWKL